VARIRTIKPEFWSDERVGECSVSARLLLIASLNFSDDHGGLDRSAKQLKAQAFPYDDIDCEPLVRELIKVGLFIEYSVNGKKYLHIKGFRKHQKVEKPAKPRIPVYEESVTPPRLLPDYSPSPHLGVAVSSSEGKGREGKGSREEPLRQLDSAPSEEGRDPEPASPGPDDSDRENADPDLDPEAYLVWTSGLAFLGGESRRSMLAKLVRQYGQPKVARKLGELMRLAERPDDPTGYLIAAMRAFDRKAVF
jgi:hypothetical protein